MTSPPPPLLCLPAHQTHTPTCCKQHCVCGHAACNLLQQFPPADAAQHLQPPEGGRTKSSSSTRHAPHLLKTKCYGLRFTMKQFVYNCYLHFLSPEQSLANAACCEATRWAAFAVQPTRPMIAEVIMALGAQPPQLINTAHTRNACSGSSLTQPPRLPPPPSASTQSTHTPTQMTVHPPSPPLTSLTALPGGCRLPVPR